MRDISVLESLTKTVGSLGLQMVKCGRENCKCAKDPSKRHGPYYYYRFWKLDKNGKYSQKKLHINKNTHGKLGSAIEIYKKEVGGFRGTYWGDRQTLQQRFLSGEKIKQSVLKNFEFKVADVFKLANS